LRLFQNFSFGTATFKKRSFAGLLVRRLEPEKLQEPSGSSLVQNRAL
jgi:hypothetical protein